MVKIICGWCKGVIDIGSGVSKTKSGERTGLICPHCTRTLPSSKIELTGNTIGRKHIHTDYKEGDRA